MNQWYSLLTKDQIDNIYRNQKSQLGKYFALWSESGHLDKYMITLSPTINTLDETIALRKDFFKKLNNKKLYIGKQVAYFSAIEIGLNKNSPSSCAQITEATRIKVEQKNFHIHIQIFTDMSRLELREVLNKIDQRLCTYSNITSPTKRNIKYDYVVKDIKRIDWKLQYIIKTQFKHTILYTSSRKQFANYVITKLWFYMKKTYKNKWSNQIKDKYTFILNLKKKGDFILHRQNMNTVQLNAYDSIYIREKGLYIYMKKNVL